MQKIVGSIPTPPTMVRFFPHGNVVMDFNRQAEEIAALLVKSTLIHKDKELACAGLLYESLRKRFGGKEDKED